MNQTSDFINPSWFFAEDDRYAFKNASRSSLTWFLCVDRAARLVDRQLLRENTQLMKPRHRILRMPGSNIFSVVEFMDVDGLNDPHGQ
jgi:hypothetical protein